MEFEKAMQQVAPSVELELAGPSSSFVEVECSRFHDRHEAMENLAKTVCYYHFGQVAEMDERFVSRSATQLPLGS
jgi:hypothetical protein